MSKTLQELRKLPVISYLESQVKMSFLSRPVLSCPTLTTMTTMTTMFTMNTITNMNIITVETMMTIATMKKLAVI